MGTTVYLCLFLLILIDIQFVSVTEAKIGETHLQMLQRDCEEYPPDIVTEKVKYDRCRAIEAYLASKKSKPQERRQTLRDNCKQANDGLKRFRNSGNSAVFNSRKRCCECFVNNVPAEKCTRAHLTFGDIYCRNQL